MRELLLKLNACEDARIWAADKSWLEVYNTCHRGDWLLWLWFKTMDHDSEHDFKLLTLAKAKCANTVRHLMSDKRSTDAIDACIAFYEGKITKKELAAYTTAAAAATSAAAAASAYAATVAAYAAAYAAYAASYAASASASAASAAYAAASASASAASAAYAAASAENRKLTADIVRECILFENWNIK